jgi:hypothetical protein
MVETILFKARVLRCKNEAPTSLGEAEGARPSVEVIVSENVWIKSLKSFFSFPAC